MRRFLEPGDLITHVTLPPPSPGNRSLYLKLRDRASFEFALASAAVVITADGGKITRARVALGGVGTKPWRSPEAEAELTGQSATEDVFRKAAEAALRDAKPQSQNGFKVELAKRCLVHALKLVTRRLTNMNMPTVQETPTTSPIGRDTPRIDGPLKVSGTAHYASDFYFPGLLYAVPVEATIAKGKITKLDTAAAEKLPGVRAILHRQNIGKIFRSTPGQGMTASAIERRPPFEDDVIRYYGQYVALAVADTFESAKAAADAVRR